MRGRVLTLAGLLLLAAAAPAAAEMTPTPTPSRLPPAPSAEGEYARGVAATRAKEWSVAAVAFSRAVEMKPAYPEAWNGLGFALRNQGKYAESLEAYDEALRLRPDYPDALEYLGEAYVKLGRLEDARRVLERLKPLDRERARELSEAIARAK
jgi:tetratricopeptide (TPR) repeat protein